MFTRELAEIHTDSMKIVTEDSENAFLYLASLKELNEEFRKIWCDNNFMRLFQMLLFSHTYFNVLAVFFFFLF